ncbi:glutamine-hydrolyzing GMP synthase [Mucispirillum schaedleri]|uniref:GMP synthase [glutamine-hydrolyzing] n=1 Tax=Mucispirillum schaedleri ASF457 TaxID=1379858 RepID=V2QC18_9BACT|nr:glutamine-hydrolyzing GMP synthase [Mucispirillum schaedleri]MCX4360345.1 glutamine-hydrolyzing GMP synthase [Mucispirillum schaedleri]USF24512.1 GMP synthase [glutamine-hydrolyzing] [Mucispirillum schaedleri ASF457]SIW07243.1 GMP synthetase (glutamine aminotransferase) [Mucispirillum schaedleri ASF457]
MDLEKILILDFGGQYSKLIARRTRECGVFSEILSYTSSPERIMEKGYKAIILSGGPASVYEANAPQCDKAIFDMGLPVLGICYGAQLMANLLDGYVEKSGSPEYGSTMVQVDKKAALFASPNVEDVTATWMSHTDYIKTVPYGFNITAKTENCPVAAMENNSRKLYAVQFHPEVTNSIHGMDMLKTFLFDICGFKGNWKMSSFIDDAVAKIKEKAGNGKALCALSGGVDSSVAALLVQKAIGDRLTCVFVDHGLLRKNEGDEVEAVFSKFGLNLIRVNAGERFLAKLKDVEDPEQKRKIIGSEFIAVFEEEAKKLGSVDYLVQGTIYPDVIESGAGSSAMIKSHHNVGGLPETMDFKGLIEPLRELFKDEVRKVGLDLGLPENLVMRQPFPGPGLGVRIIGKITAEKVAILQDADAVFREEIAAAGLDREISQYFAALTDMRSVGVMGDSRTYYYTVGLRAVITSDFMTAEWARIPHEVLAKTSNRIVNEVHGINRVVYDITTKPPATVEWL